MRLAAIASALAILLCAAVFGAIFLQRTSVSGPAPSPALAAPGEEPASAVGASARLDAGRTAPRTAPNAETRGGAARAPARGAEGGRAGRARSGPRHHLQQSQRPGRRSHGRDRHHRRAWV